MISHAAIATNSFFEPRVLVGSEPYHVNELSDEEIRELVVLYDKEYTRFEENTQSWREQKRENEGLKKELKNMRIQNARLRSQLTRSTKRDNERKRTIHNLEAQLKTRECIKQNEMALMDDS